MLDFQSDSFDPKAFGWSVRNANALACCSELAYEDAGTVQSRLGQWNLQYVDFLNKQNTQVFLAKTAACGIVCFRGTEPTNAFDWATDANVLQVKGPFGMVHSGFSAALDLVWPTVRDFIAQTVQAAQPVFVAGHSLGGALACLTIARALEEGAATPDRLSLHTIGQPRVGDADFADAMNQQMAGRMVRVVNNIDLVPRVPPRRSPIGAYQHCDGVVWIDVDGHLHRDQRYWRTLLELLDFDPQPEPAEGIQGLRGLLEKFRPRGRSLLSLVELGAEFLTSSITRTVLRSIGKDTLKDPVAMIVDHFKDRYTRLLEAPGDPLDSPVDGPDDFPK